ncbi:MAG: gamma-glutamyltransferase, partial [Dehalococcoidia bacterium]
VVMSTIQGPLVSSARSAVLSKKGIVCSTTPLAGAVGAQVLREGGNAFDAAVATASAEAVLIPPMCGLGGEVFALMYEASSGKLYGLSGSGRAPMTATREYFVEKGYTKMPGDGPLTPAVPGEVHAWQTILDRFGTRKLGALVQPAIGFAEDGFPIPGRLSKYFTDYIDKINKFTSTSKVLSKNGGSYVAGDVLVQKDLARSLRRVAEGGPDEFYRGALAKELAAAIQAAGGLISEEDLAGQTTTVYENPPSVDYRGHQVFATGLPSQGVLTLELLSLMDGFDLASMGHNSADAVHAMAECKRLAFTDRLAFIGDPEFVEVPMDELLSKEYAERRRKLVDMKKAADIVPAGELKHSAAPNPSTSYFCVVDSQGNAVSFIHSLSTYFGSGFMAGDTGIMLNDRVGRGFYLDEGHVNVVAPGKRTINTIHNYMVFKDGKPVLVGGTPGGDNQPQWNAQAISNVLDFGMNVQQAADAPRWAHFPGTDPRSAEQEMVLRMEDAISPEVKEDLGKRGHKVTPIPKTGTPGAVQLIALDWETGVHAGGTDYRCDGFPVPE